MVASYHREIEGRTGWFPFEGSPGPCRTIPKWTPTSLDLDTSTETHLVELDVLRQTARADSVQQAQRSQSVDLTGVFSHVKGDFHVGLSSQVVDFRGTNLGNDVNQASGIRQIAVMQDHHGLFDGGESMMTKVI